MTGPTADEPTPATDTTAPARRDVVFTSGGQACAGWWYPAHTSEATAACVVLAHGFSLTRGDGLDP